MSEFNWTTFTVRINVNASVDTLYNAWSTRGGMEKWFLRLSEYKQPNGKLREEFEQVQKGDLYRWMWHGWPDDMVEHGDILDCNGKDFLKFKFGDAGNCSVTIKNENGYNIVELLQDEITDDEKGRAYWHLGCKTGWTFYFANLKSILEGGLDLRNKDEKLQKVINS